MFRAMRRKLRAAGESGAISVTGANFEDASGIACDRSSYRGREDRELRITFDENIRWRGEELQLAGGGLVINDKNLRFSHGLILPFVCK